MATYTKSKPIVIVGPHRSGTSHLRKCITTALEIPSFTEGYIWPILNGTNKEIKYVMDNILGGEDSAIGADFSIKQFKRENILDGTIKALDIIHQQRLDHKIWLDKTPGEEMIRVLPIFMNYFEDAKIIFMKRNGIGNILSRQRRFKFAPFVEHCQSWANTILAWQKIKNQLPSESLMELDQKEMAKAPVEVVKRLASFLKINDKNQENHLVELLSGSTENTSQKSLDGSLELYLEDSGWDQSKIFDFLFFCHASMETMNYPVYKNNSTPIVTISKNPNKWCQLGEVLKRETIHKIHPNARDEPKPEFGFLNINCSGKKKLQLMAESTFKSDKNPGVIISLELYETYSNVLVLSKEMTLNPAYPYTFEYFLPSSLSACNLLLKVELPVWATSNEYTGTCLQAWLE